MQAYSPIFLRYDENFQVFIADAILHSYGDCKRLRSSAVNITSDASKLRVYAHSLNSTFDEATGTYTFTYSTNVQAQSGRIVFYCDSMYIFPVEQEGQIVRKDTVIWNQEVGSYNLGQNIQPGTHSVQITKYELPQHTHYRAYRNMTWAVELKDERVTQIYKIYENKKFRCPQGIAIDNNPDSEFFGRIYVANAPSDRSDVPGDAYDAGIVVLDPVSNQDIPFQKVGDGKTAYKPEGWNFPDDPDSRADHHWFMQSIAVNPKNNHVYFAKSTDSDADGASGTAVYEMTPNTENVLTGSKYNNVVAGLSDITRVNSIAFDEKGNLYLINEATNVEEKDNGVTKYRATGKLFKLKQKDDDAAYDIAIQLMTPEDTLTKTEVANVNYGRYSKDLSHWYNPYNSLFIHARGGIWVSQFEGNNLDKYPVLGHLHMDNYGDSDKPKKEFQLDIAWRPTRYYNKHLGEDHWSSYAPFWNAQMLFGDYVVEHAEVNYGDGNQKTYVETKDIGGVIAYHEKGGRYSKSAFLAVAALDTVHIFAIKYEDVFPSWRNEWYGFGIDHLCKIPIEGVGTVSANRPRPLITSMAFDYAGNLYVASEKAHSLTVYSFQNYDAIDPTQHLCPDAWTKEEHRPSGDNVLNRNNPLDDNFTAVPARKELTASGVVAFNDNTNDHQWSTPGNWSTGKVPYYNESVIIMSGKTAEISGREAQAYGVELEAGSKIVIHTTGGLTVGPEGLVKTGGTCVEQSEADRILIESTPSASGFLRISPDFTKCEPYVTVNYTSSAEPPVGSTSNDDAKWQYMGAPVSGVNAYVIDGNTVIYNWNEQEGWVKERNTVDLTPFVGYALTQKYPGVVRTFVGQMIRQDKTIDLTYTDTEKGMKGDNLFVNSYLAPINMTTITEEDWVDKDNLANKTFYLFNSGSWNQWQASLEGNNDTIGVRDNSPGHYYAIPAFGAKYLTEADQIVIPTMQGVYIARQSGSEPVQLKLNYRKHVWNYGGRFDRDLTQIREADMNHPMRVVSNERASIKRVRMHVYGLNSGADRAYVIEKQGCSQGYDNGYDAENIFVDNLVNIYTQEEFGQMEVSFSDDIDSTYIGLAAGVDSVYTLTIGALEGKGLYLRDLTNDSVMPLSDGLRYTFVAAPNSVNDHRFQILLDKDIPSEEPGNNTGNNGVTTDINDITSTLNCWYDNDNVYFTNAYAGMMVSIYDINGRMITSSILAGNTGSVDVANLPEGVYLVKAMGNVTKFVK